MGEYCTKFLLKNFRNAWIPGASFINKSSRKYPKTVVGHFLGQSISSKHLKKFIGYKFALPRDNVLYVPLRQNVVQLC